MGWVAEYLDPAAWSRAFHEGVSALDPASFWLTILQIVVINVLLWGDNAVVIGMACRGLPPRQRFWGVAIGAGVSALLLVVFTGLVTRLMALPYVKLIGGLALLYIAAKLLVPSESDEDHGEAPAHLWRVVRIVLLIDLVMSLDNVIAVAAAARGNIVLLMIGVIISIPIILGGAALSTAMFERFPILVWAGTALLGWIAGGVIASDPAIADYLTAALGQSLAERIEIVASIVGALLVIAAGALWRRWHARRR